MAAGLALLAALACADAGAREGERPGGAGDEGRRTMHVVRSGQETVEVAVGETVDLVVTRPVGIRERPPRGWPAPPRPGGGRGGWGDGGGGGGWGERGGGPRIGTGGRDGKNEVCKIRPRCESPRC